MSNNIELLQKAILESQITRAEAAELFQVTRNTLYRWLTGKPVRYKLSEQLAVYQARRLLVAVANGQLPLPEGTENRQQNIIKILKGTSQA
jgi:transposase-like protein